jgi:radical SAM protein with 4Fe4S-binding SPASM domain
MPPATGREAGRNGYWSARRHLRYYEVVRRCLEEAGPGRILIDVGSHETPVVTFGRFARRIAVDSCRCGEYPGVEAHVADWMDFELGERASVITCLQVLEHLSDAAAGPFARKLLSSAEIVIVSVPYLWPAGQDADHLQDPMDEAKLATIMGREPSESAVVAEHPTQLSHRRLVAVYRRPAAHEPSVHALSSDLAVVPAPSTAIRTVGWTLGNDCPYQCKHCYSFTVRRKGRNMERWMVDRIVHQLAENRISSVNLGGNEPLFTNGTDPRQSLLPYIIDLIHQNGLVVGLTTAGITLTYLDQHHPGIVSLINDVDISLDSPYEIEHNQNRGANLFPVVLDALSVAQRRGIPRTIVMCGMSWNFTPDHLADVVRLARRYDAFVRINTLKPVEPSHTAAELPPSRFYEGFRQLMDLCDPVDLGEPPLAALLGSGEPKGCPCGRTSCRIHSITPQGRVPVSPCVYLHSYATGDLLADDLRDIVGSAPFDAFHLRNTNPHWVQGCEGCRLLASCRGGCAARSYLHSLHHAKSGNLLARDPYCPRDVPSWAERYPSSRPESKSRLVHQDYLCTWIGKPKESPEP